MTFLLTAFQKSQQVRFATKLTLNPPENGVKNLLAYAVDNRVVFEHSNPDPSAEKRLVFSYGLVSSNPVKGLAMVPGKGKLPRVAILTQSHISIVEASSTDFYDDLYIDWYFFLENPLTLEVDPIFLSCWDSRSAYLILYEKIGFITIFNVEALQQRKKNEQQSRKRSNNLGPCDKTFSIGNIVVCSMAVSNATTPAIIAVLYRDIDFNYSLRYHAIKPNLESLPVVRQMEQFVGAPSHVMATEDGFLVAGDLKLWFFPMLNKSVSLADSAGDPKFPVSYNKVQNVVTLDLSANKMSYLGSRFESSTTIDKNRHLLVSDSGTTLLVYLEVSCVGSITTVNQFQVVDLGKSTIPSSLVHLEDNVFFAASKRSRSVLFRILPKAPYIDILTCLSNSSPILNINLDNDLQKTLLLSRGDVHGGEIEIVSDSPWKIERSGSAQISVEASSVTIVKSAGSELLVMKDDDGEITDVLTCASLDVATPLPLDSQGIDTKQQGRVGTAGNSQSGTITHWQIDSSRTIEHDSKKPGQITLKSHMEVTVLVEQVNQITSLDWFDNGSSLEIYIASWNGTLTHLLFTENSAKVIGTVSTGLEGKISLLRFRVDDTHFWLVLLDGAGVIFHIPVFKKELGGDPEWNLEESQYAAAAHTSGTFHMSQVLNGHFLIHDNFSVFLVHQDKKSTNCLTLTRLYTFKYNVHDCALVECVDRSGSFVVVSDDGILGKYQFKDKQGKHDSYASEGLIVSTANLDASSVIALQLESSPNLSTGQMDTIPSLLLLRRPTLALLSVYKPRDNSDYVDFCIMDGKYTSSGHPYIIVANNAEDPRDMIKVFQVVSETIEPVCITGPFGKLPKTYSFSKITCHKNRVCLVGDVSVKLNVQISDGKEIWRGNVLRSDGSPFYVADVDGNDDFWILADAVRGAFALPFKSTHLAKINTTVDCCTTAVALKTKPIFICGDFEGGIYGAVMVSNGTNHATYGKSKPLKFSELFHYNIENEQINDIFVLSEDPITILFATVKGNVYRLQDISMHKHADEYIRSSVGESLDTSSHPDIHNLVDVRDVVRPKSGNGMSVALQIELAKVYSDVSACSYKINYAED